MKYSDMYAVLRRLWNYAALWQEQRPMSARIEWLQRGQQGDYVTVSKGYLLGPSSAAGNDEGGA